MADETLSTKIDRILAEYDKIITASTQTKERYTEIVAIRDSIATLKNTLTNDITTAKSQIKEASDTLTRAQRIGIDIEGKGKSYVNYIKKTLDSIEVLGSKTTENLEKITQTALERIKEQTLEDTSELTELGKNLKWELQQCANTLKTELSPFLTQLNNANAAIEELIARARSAADSAETTKGDVLRLLEDARAEAQSAQENHEMLVTQSQNIKTRLSELCDKSIVHLQSAQALMERFESLKDELGEADIEALFKEILTNNKREVLAQIIDSLLAEENAQAILERILSDGTALLSDIKREGSKAIGSIASLKTEAENAHIKGYTNINTLYNAAITEIRQARELSLGEMKTFQDETKKTILNHLQIFNQNVQECVQMLLQSYHDFQHQLQNSKTMLESLRDKIIEEMHNKHDTLSQEFQSLYNQCAANLLKNKDHCLSAILAEKDATMKELHTFFESLRLECAFLKQSLNTTIEKAQDTIQVIVKGSFQKEINTTLNSTYWNNALTLAQLLYAYFIKVEAHHRIDNSEQILAAVQREKAIIVDARGLVAKSLDETRILSTRLREYAAMAEFNSFMEVI